MHEVDPQRLLAHVQHLAERIGPRLAGTAEEQAAADYVATQLEQVGATVNLETFPTYSRVVEQQHLEVQCGSDWKEYACSLLSNTPGTEGQVREGPLVFFESPSESSREDLSYLRGKAVVHLGTHIESRDTYRRLVSAEPAFILMVDIRYPGSVPLADGMFPTYSRSLGAVPTVNVAYLDAWQWCRDGATAARLMVRGGMRKGASQNVIANLPAAVDSEEILFLGAHHDTQADSPGADDNGSGVAGLIELARLLAPLPRRRTVRLISFGAEEQLSVGSAHYVRAHRAEIQKRGQFLFNLDSFGSPMGWNELTLNGDDRLRDYLKGCFQRQNLPVRIVNECIPYFDHFPLVAAGVPAVTLMRPNCTSGRFFHHRPDDDLSRVSPRVMANLLRAVGTAMSDLATAERLPFAKQLPVHLREQIESYWNDLFGGWEGS